jgi:hypothetical protein
MQAKARIVPIVTRRVEVGLNFWFSRMLAGLSPTGSAAIKPPSSAPSRPARPSRPSEAQAQSTRFDRQGRSTRTTRRIAPEALGRPRHTPWSSRWWTGSPTPTQDQGDRDRLCPPGGLSGHSSPAPGSPGLRGVLAAPAPWSCSTGIGNTSKGETGGRFLRYRSGYPERARRGMVVCQRGID